MKHNNGTMAFWVMVNTIFKLNQITFSLISTKFNDNLIIN
jgi:hypothetical protein